MNPLSTVLWRRKRVRQFVQTVRVARTVSPALGFIVGVARDLGPRRYYSKLLDRGVYLRPRADLQIARELLSQNIYELPPEVRNVLDSRPVPLTVLDLGAHVGLFSLTMIRMLGAGTRVVAVEPDPTNFAVLETNLSPTGVPGQFTLHRAAAGIHPGSARFDAGHSDVSHVVPEDGSRENSIEVPVIDALSLAEACDFIKIDIEGSEWELLRDPRLSSAGAAALIVEWHDTGSGLRDPAGEAVRLLREAGFQTREVPSQPTVGMVWGWRP